jgi:hypothetical protein
MGVERAARQVSRVELGEILGPLWAEAAESSLSA